MQKVTMEIKNSKVIVYGNINNKNFDESYVLTDFHSDDIYFTNLLRKLKNIKIYVAFDYRNTDDIKDFNYVSEFLNHSNCKYATFNIFDLDEEFINE